MGAAALTWPDRIANYERRIGPSFLAYQAGWCAGTWLMGNSYETANDHYGGFQGNFLKRIDALFPDRGRVLHLFAGRVALDRFPGDTLDADPALEPTWCVGPGVAAVLTASWRRLSDVIISSADNIGRGCNARSRCTACARP
jgi:hypothetical protein